MYQIELKSDVSTAEWKALLSHSQHSTVFHTQEWIKVLTDTFPNYEPCYIVTYDSCGQLVGGMPIINDKRYGISNYLSLPYSTYGGPVVRCEDHVLGVNILLKKYYDIIRYSKGLSWIVDFYEICDRCKDMGFEPKICSTQILNLKNSLEEIWKHSINRKKRNEIRQAQKKGVFLRPVSCIADVRDCYEMILEVSKKHHSLPMPLKLYENIFEKMVATDLCKWNIAYCDDVPIANSIFFTYNDSIFYWMNSSFQKYNQKRPNDLLIYSMIEWGIENGYSSMNFGSSPGFAQGLLRFKESWGTQQRNYFIFERRPFYFEMAYTLHRAINSVRGRMLL